ncbi:MAG: helix-turn-helix transcriptional regulator [Phaeodactylibacter sp.]|nr:helix-turn-helix transcriptional regulator [Phaeodactylibacter sp.]
MPTEEKFLRKASRIVEENLSDPGFGVHELYRELNMGRTQLHKLLKAHTGKSASLFIRSVRLQHAQTLLASSELNVSEVAYRVGFNDPNYFSRCYREMFGVAPSKDRS